MLVRETIIEVIIYYPPWWKCVLGHTINAVTDEQQQRCNHHSNGKKKNILVLCNFKVIYCTRVHGF